MPSPWELLSACSRRDIEEVRRLLQDPQTDIEVINYQEEFGEKQTPLYLACERGYTEIVELLLSDQRVDVNKATGVKQTPLYRACEKGHTEIVRLLLKDERVDVNKGGWTKATPLYVACYDNYIEIVKLLLNDERVDVNQEDIQGWAPFYIACEKGFLEIVLMFSETPRVNKDIKLSDIGQVTLAKAQRTFESNRTERNQRLISTPKIREITKEAEEFSTFQIHFLPFHNLLELEKIPKYEDCKDKLINFTFEEMKETTKQLVFISHRWLSDTDPDPHSEQLEAIKKYFKSDPIQHRILIWYDYFSMPQHFDNDSIQKRVDTIHRLNQIVTFSDSFLVLPTDGYYERCWCFYEWSAAVFTGQKVQIYPNEFQTPEESLSFLSEKFDSFHGVDGKPLKDSFIEKFQAKKPTDKNIVWDNLMKVYDEEIIIRYKEKLDTSQVRDWSIDKTCSWLTSIQFSQYQDIFREHKINGSFLFNLYFEHQGLFQNDEDYQKFLEKLEILIPIETWNEIDFSLWIKSQNWNETEITEECCQITESLNLFPKMILKDQTIEKENLKEYLISEIFGNVLSWKCKNGLNNNLLLYFDGSFKEIVKKLLNDERVDINQVNENGWTLFYVACQKGETEIVKLLLSNEKVDVNQPSNANQSPFWIACCNGRIEAVKLLLNDERIDVNKAENSDGWTPFYIACDKENIEVVKLLLNDDRIDVNKPGNLYNKTPLWIACDKGRIEIVKLLLGNERVDVNKPMNGDWTPLAGACYARRIEIVKLLLNDSRVDINRVNRYDQTPLQIAHDQGCIEIVKLLNQRAEKNEEKAEKEQVEVPKHDDHHIKIEKLDHQSNLQHNIDQEQKEEKKEGNKEGNQEENVSKLLQDIQNEIILTGELLKLTNETTFKKWQPRVFDLRLQSLAWKKFKDGDYMCKIF